MDYKLLTKIQKSRINKYLPRIIDADQRRLMRDCCISSKILELQNLIDYVNENSIASQLMCIDFEKHVILLNRNFYSKC